jgi:hypothetical protein
MRDASPISRTAAAARAAELEAVLRTARSLHHELNNQLTVIVGELDLVLLDADLPDALRPAIDRALDRATHATSILRELQTVTHAHTEDC